MKTISCYVSGMMKSAMITECWTPQSNHRDTVFPIYIVFGNNNYYNNTYAHTHTHTHTHTHSVHVNPILNILT